MCTIMTFDFSTYDQNREKITDRIIADGRINPDGWCLVLVDSTEVFCRLQSMDLELILTVLNKSHWDRFFLHSRYSTGGEITLTNTHGFDSNGYIIMHNGVLRDRSAKLYTVDSHMIKDFVSIDLDYAVEKLHSEEYANVFLIDTQGLEYTVSRSVVGTLHNDTAGNYSTNPIPGLCDSVVSEFYSMTYVFGDPSIDLDFDAESFGLNWDYLDYKKTGS